MPHSRIEAALTICREHVDQLDNESPSLPEVETYLVAGLVLLIVSEYEELIEQLFVRRAERSGDIGVAHFVRQTMATKFRSPDLNKITESLGKFGGTYREQFSSSVLNSEAHAAWDNIMRARHAVVHKRGYLHITLRELQHSYTKTKDIISTLEDTLGT